MNGLAEKKMDHWGYNWSDLEGGMICLAQWCLLGEGMLLPYHPGMLCFTYIDR